MCNLSKLKTSIIITEDYAHIETQERRWLDTDNVKKNMHLWSKLPKRIEDRGPQLQLMILIKYYVNKVVI